MNPADILNNPLIQRLLPILKALGIDPEQIAADLAEAKVKASLTAALHKTTARLKADGMTPAVVAVTPEGERLFVRSALYLSVKYALLTLPAIPFGEAYLADYIRDAHEAEVLAIVGPQIDAATKPKAAVVLINAALMERMF